MSAGRRLLARALPELGTVRDVLADRGYRGLGKMATKSGLNLQIKAPSKGASGFTGIKPLYKVEHAFARLGRWRRLSRCYEGSAESARAWLEVAALGYCSHGSGRSPPDRARSAAFRELAYELADGGLVGVGPLSLTLTTPFGSALTDTSQLEPSAKPNST